jgi:hypothetical protein
VLIYYKLKRGVEEGAALLRKYLPPLLDKEKN